MTPKIAIVIPVYNVARYLPECLDSVLSQTYKNFTVFAIDDGATDNSGKILDEYASKDNRIKVTHKSNGGVSSARNVALEQIEATDGFDYVCFIDPDDYISQSYFEKFVPLIRQYWPDIAFCGLQKFDRTGLVPNNKPLVKAINPCDHETLISRLTGTGKWKSTGADTSGLCNLLVSSNLVLGKRFDTSINYAEDTLFNFEITAKAKTGAYVDEILYFYRQRRGSLVRTNDKTPAAILFCKHFFDFPEQMRPFVANCVLTFVRQSVEVSLTRNVNIPKERIQRVIAFAKKHFYKTKYDEEIRSKYKKMLSWPAPLFRFYIRFLRKSTLNSTDRQLNLFD